MRVAIVGCGYLGLELGRQLDAAGHDVVGVRRSDQGLAAVEEAGLAAVRADATDPASLEAVPDVDWLVYAASAGRGGDRRATYVDGLGAAAAHFATRPEPPDRLLYTSSTGVYGDRGGDWVDETAELDPATERERVLVEAEAVALDGPLEATVVRLGGLYGPGRYGVERLLDGPVAAGYRNHVHVEDAAGAIAFLLTGAHAAGEVLNVVDDEPAWKPDLAAWLADRLGEPQPAVRTKEEIQGDDAVDPSRKRRLLADKRVSNDRLRRLGYALRYPTYRAGYAAALEDLA